MDGLELQDILTHALRKGKLCSGASRGWVSLERAVDLGAMHTP